MIPSRRAFTLVEMLVVCTLLTVVSGTAVAIMSGGLRVWDRLREHGDDTQRVMAGFSRIRTDLARMRRFELLPFDGAYDRIAFAGIRLTDDAAGRELARVGYYADARGRRLCRSVTPFRTADRTRLSASCDAVLEGVSRVRFSFLTRDPETGTFKWESGWRSAQPPSAVRLELVSNEDPAGKGTARSLTVGVPIAAPAGGSAAR